jgi:methyl-accepting chemotaxis protein
MTFRERYNRKMGLGFLIGLFLHLPVFIFLAFRNDHGLLSTLGLSGLILAGPTLAYMAQVRSTLLPNLLAFAGMSFSGLLIHLGNGMIEMHFHVFIMLAIMITFALRTPVVTAVLTIAIHHVAFFFFLPKSVFNYEASFGIVLLHAGFVILESIPVYLIALKFKYFIDLQDTTLSQLEPISERNIQLVGVVDATGRELTVSTARGRASLQDTSSSLVEINLQVEQNKGSSGTARELSKGSKELVDKGLGDIQNLLQTVKQISGSSDKIRDIVSIIDDIAFQTNLLALNAAVEAARAGEQGNGFGVVAEAVRNLALKSATSAKEIGSLLNTNIEEIEKSERMAENSSHVLGKIQISIDKVFVINSEIATSSENQHRDIKLVRKHIAEVLNLMEQVNTSAINLNESSTDLQNDALGLNKLIQQISDKDKSVA